MFVASEIPHSYNSSGTYTSYLDAGAALSYTWNSFTWVQTANGGSIAVKVKTTPTAVAPSFASGTCDGSSSGTGATITLTDTCRNTAHRYIWYQSTLTAPSGNENTPTLDSTSVSVTDAFYYSTGTYTSGAVDTGQLTYSWGNLGWNQTLNGGTIKFLVATSKCLNGGTNYPTCNTGTWAYKDSTGTTQAECSGANCYTASGDGDKTQQINAAHNGDQYIRYKAFFTSPSPYSATPSLNSVTLNYNYFPNQTLTSPAYDSEDYANLLSKISWHDSGTSATETVRFQIRSAPDSGGSPNWGSGSGWCGYADSGDTCAGTNYFTSAHNDLSLPFSSHPLNRGSNDQWIQYRVYLASGGMLTPTLNDLTITYVVNGPPEFDSTFGQNSSGVNVTQISDSADPQWGKVKIEYSICDQDTADGTVTPNYVTPSFKYTVNGGSTWPDIDMADITWGTVPTNGEIVDDDSDGDLENKVLGGSPCAYLTYTAYWDPYPVYASHYEPDLGIRVTITDNEAANAIATGTTLVNNALDTQDPVCTPPEIAVDATDQVGINPATLILDCTDNTTDNLKMEVNLTDSYPAVFTAAYADSSTLTLENDPDTVYLRLQDKFGNTSDSSYQATTPQTPTEIMVQDVSNLYLNPDLLQLMIAWEEVEEPTPGFQQYEVYRTTNPASWDAEPYATVSSKSQNYYIDDTPADKFTTYYYRIATRDDDGNASYLSAQTCGKANGTQDACEGGGGAPPGEFPDITVATINVTSTTSTTATITWETDELSDSIVQYIKQEDGNFETNDEDEDILYQGTPTLYDADPDHVVTLTNLEPSKPYYFKIVSASPVHNTTDSAYKDASDELLEFTTDEGPAITGLTVSSETNDGAR